MSRDQKLDGRFRRLMAAVDTPESVGTRLAEEGRRLWQRLQRLLDMHLTPPELDREAMELACYALQLPDRGGRGAGKLVQVNLKERAEQAAELIVESLNEKADEALAARTAELLRQLPQKSPELLEAKLLADAVNLDDFGLTWLMLTAMQLGRQQEALASVADGFEKRQQYGYWEARLKDGFHFEPVRQMARARLAAARQAASLLLSELAEDQAR